MKAHNYGHRVVKSTWGPHGFNVELGVAILELELEMPITDKYRSLLETAKSGLTELHEFYKNHNR